MTLFEADTAVPRVIPEIRIRDTLSTDAAGGTSIGTVTIGLKPPLTPSDREHIGDLGITPKEEDGMSIYNCGASREAGRLIVAAVNDYHAQSGSEARIIGNFRMNLPMPR